MKESNAKPVISIPRLVCEDIVYDPVEFLKYIGPNQKLDIDYRNLTDVHSLVARIIIDFNKQETLSQGINGVTYWLRYLAERTREFTEKTAREEIRERLLWDKESK